MAELNIQYWLGVACSEHAFAGRDMGIAQLGHGKHIAVKNLHKGDWIIYYSPKTKLAGGEKGQSFTTIGKITSDQAYQTEQSQGFCPWRVDVDYIPTIKPVPIHFLLDELDLTKNRGSNWGMAVRTSKVKLSFHDFQIISQAMGIEQESFSAK